MEITLRDVAPSDAAALAHIVVSANENAFRGLVPDQCFEFTETESAANWQHMFVEGLPADDFMLMAETTTGACAGYVWAGINTKDSIFQAELRQLMLLPAYQKRGLGRQLVTAVAQRLASQQRYSMRVEVLHINPNRPFYQHLGATYVSEFPYDWDGIPLSMCVYGWDDIRSQLTMHRD